MRTLRKISAPKPLTFPEHKAMYSLGYHAAHDIMYNRHIYSGQYEGDKKIRAAHAKHVAAARAIAPKLSVAYHRQLNTLKKSPVLLKSFTEGYHQARVAGEKAAYKEWAKGFVPGTKKRHRAG